MQCDGYHALAGDAVKVGMQCDGYRALAGDAVKVGMQCDGYRALAGDAADEGHKQESMTVGSGHNKRERGRGYRVLAQQLEGSVLIIKC